MRGFSALSTFAFVDCSIPRVTAATSTQAGIVGLSQLVTLSLDQFRERLHAAARVLGMEATGAGLQRIKAHVPMAETFRYGTDLRSMTGGRGTFSAELLGYEECPSHIAQKVIAAHEEQAEEPAAAR